MRNATRGINTCHNPESDQYQLTPGGIPERSPDPMKHPTNAAIAP
ncbi:MAG: hypothetical protein NTV10_03510 [Methanoregula sp.]|nr:hypothetical protein [Methanoregula sp.]